MTDMSRERLQHEGRLAVKERQIKEVRLKLESLRTGLRFELDPFDGVDALKADIIASLGLEFAAKHGQLAELLAEAAAIRQALGRGRV